MKEKNGVFDVMQMIYYYYNYKRNTQILKNVKLLKQWR